MHAIHQINVTFVEIKPYNLAGLDKPMHSMHSINNKWRLVCRNWAIDCSTKVNQLFDARHGVKKRCQRWHRLISALGKLDACLASFFDAMSGVKKLTNSVSGTINCPQLRQTSLHERHTSVELTGEAANETREVSAPRGTQAGGGRGGGVPLLGRGVRAAAWTTHAPLIHRQGLRTLVQGREVVPLALRIVPGLVRWQALVVLEVMDGVLVVHSPDTVHHSTAVPCGVIISACIGVHPTFLRIEAPFRLLLLSLLLGASEVHGIGHWRHVWFVGVWEAVGGRSSDCEQKVDYEDWTS